MHLRLLIYLIVRSIREYLLTGPAIDNIINIPTDLVILYLCGGSTKNCVFGFLTRRLRLEYVDLCLIHFPVRMKKEAKDGYNLEKGNLLEFDVKGTWEAMEECSELGLAKSIGVSNFGPKKLSQILQLICTIPPAVKQVLLHFVLP